MNTIGNITNQAAALPRVPAAPAVPQVLSAKQAAASYPQLSQTPDIPNAHAIENQRQAAVLQAARDIANVYVVSDQKFAIFKDATGQYVTRFTNLRTGKVTYIPEPQLLKASKATAPLLAIKA